jgi:hypothetical protein
MVPLPVRRSALAAGFALLAFPAPALEGPPIADNNFKVDIGQTVVLGSSRRLGMGGAHVAVAEGAAMVLDNPAAVAFRPARSARKRWDWDATFGVFSAAGDDLDNNGSRSFDYESDQVFTAGALYQKGRWGAGFFNVSQNVELDGAAGRNRLKFENFALAVGRQHWDRRLTWGLGFRMAQAELRTGAGRDRAFNMGGTGLTAGAVWHPGLGPFRLGAAYAGPVHEDEKRALNASGAAPATANGLILPEQVTAPVVASVGAAYEWPSAPFWSGRRFLAAADVRVFGRLTDAVGVESFLEQKVQKSGQSLDVGLHLGGELEVLPGRLRARLGTYREPSRFAGVRARQHATAGLELRLFKLRFFGERQAGFTYAGDFASRYINHFVSLGFWHF